MSDLNKLYDPIIKAHQANPYHFKKVTDSPFTIEAHNPVCGDNYDVFVAMHEGRLQSLYFHGYGCAVSMAAASVLTKTLEGKKVDEAIKICTTYLELLRGGTSSSPIPEEFHAFTAVKNFPERYDCAATAWTEVKNFLENKM